MIVKNTTTELTYNGANITITLEGDKRVTVEIADGEVTGGLFQLADNPPFKVHASRIPAGLKRLAIAQAA